MPGIINRRELAQMHRTLGAAAMLGMVTESLERGRTGQPGGLRPEEFSIRDLAEALVENGTEWVRSLDPREGASILESGSAVDSTAFANITGQILISRVLESYQNEQFVLSALVPSTSTRLNGEKIPGITGLGDQAEEVHEGMPYPSAGFSEEYIETPSTTKRGLIIPVTREAIFFDRTNLVMQRAAEVGESLGLNKEKRLIDVFIGAVNTYKRNGSTYNTYLTSGGWINDKTGVELVDWTDIEAAELLLRAITDPNTGEPILIMPRHLLVMPDKWHTARQVLNATELRVTTASSIQAITANSVAGLYQPYQSQLVKSRLVSQLSKSDADAGKMWFFGDFARAFAYMENWPITVTQAAQNSEAEFTQDIVLRFKASERGAAAVMDPRFVARLAG